MSVSKILQLIQEGIENRPLLIEFGKNYPTRQSETTPGGKGETGGCKQKGSVKSLTSETLKLEKDDKAEPFGFDA